MLDELSFTNLDSRKKNRESCGNTLSRHFSISSISISFSFFFLFSWRFKRRFLATITFLKINYSHMIKTNHHFRIRIVTIDYRYFIDIHSFRYIDNIVKISLIDRSEWSSYFFYWKLLLKSKNNITYNKLQ